jgi:hypothetical protein
MAINRIVVSDSSLCSDVTSPDVCYTSAQTAITDALAATTSDSIEIRPGTYPVSNISITKSISIQGVETARTFLTGNGSTMITVSGVTNLMTISRLTFINAAVGIQVNSGSSLNIKNNIFEVGGSSTAIQVSDNASSPLIMNNIFYQTGTAISSTSQNNLSIVNNIFSGNSFAISANVALAGILNNLFFGNTTIGPNIMFTSSDPAYLGNIKDSDPLFVNPTDTDITKRDFHLKYDASNTNPCKDTGNTTAGNDSIDSSTADIGAYGGSTSDTIPFPVSGLTVTATTDNSITVSWSQNNCYLVTGYNVYYDSDQSGSPYDGSDSNDASANPLPSPINAGNVTTYKIDNLDPSATAPGTPTNLTSEPASAKLTLRWDAVNGATGYNVYSDPGTCSVACSQPTTKKAAVNINYYVLDGLLNPNPNPNCYCVTVSAYAQATYYIAVKAYYVATDSSKESLAFSNEETPGIGPVQEGTTFSPPLNDFPEPITPYPNLPNKGCFIATAAYGYYSAPQVQALREFRDKYLMTNAPGRAFVRWYYTYGPVAAQFINEHPGLKPAVRVALLPAVGGAMFMTRTSALAKTILLVLSVLLALYASLRAMKTRGA